MKEWNGYFLKLDQSIIVYSVDDGKVFGGSDPERTVKQVPDSFYTPGDFSKSFYI